VQGINYKIKTDQKKPPLLKKAAFKFIGLILTSKNKP